MKHARNEQDVVCITETASIREAARSMQEHEIGSLVVIDDDGLAVGIVTDRDLCLRAVRWDRDPDETRVVTAMSNDLRTLPASAERDEQIQLMRRMGVRRVPLVDDAGRPVGLIAADDWIRWIAARLDEVATTADPSLRHGPLRPPSDLLDDLQEHLDRHLDAREEDPMQTRTVTDRTALLDAIERLRSAMSGQA
ncbi:MAG: CBS domain-containing protein [Planctomycetota bacterium]